MVLVQKWLIDTIVFKKSGVENMLEFFWWLDEHKAKQRWCSDNFPKIKPHEVRNKNFLNKMKNSLELI